MNETKNTRTDKLERDYKIYAEWRDRANKVTELTEKYGLSRQRINQIVNKFMVESPAEVTA